MKEDFKNLLIKAATDDVSLIRVLEYVMPIINKKATSYHGELDEDLKGELIEYSLKMIKNKKILKNLKNV